MRNPTQLRILSANSSSVHPRKCTLGGRAVVWHGLVSLKMRKSAQGLAAYDRNSSGVWVGQLPQRATNMATHGGPRRQRGTPMVLRYAFTLHLARVRHDAARATRSQAWPTPTTPARRSIDLGSEPEA